MSGPKGFRISRIGFIWICFGFRIWDFGLGPLNYLACVWRISLEQALYDGGGLPGAQHVPCRQHLGRDPGHGCFVPCVAFGPGPKGGHLIAADETPCKALSLVSVHDVVVHLPPVDQRGRAVGHAPGTILIVRGRSVGADEQTDTAGHLSREDIEVALRPAGDATGRLTGQAGPAQALGEILRQAIELQREALPRREQDIGGAAEECGEIAEHLLSLRSR